MTPVWFLAGALAGVVNALTMAINVRRLDPAAPVRSMYEVAGGMLARCVLVAALLMVAFGRGLGSGLVACTGFWIARLGALAWWHCIEKRKKR